MDVEFFKSLDEMLKKQIAKCSEESAEGHSTELLQEIAKYASQILAYRNVLYRVQLTTKIELVRCSYFSGIDEILSILYKDFNTLSLDQKVHLYSKKVPSPQSAEDKVKAAKDIQEKLTMLDTSWLNSYGKKCKES